MFKLIADHSQDAEEKRLLSLYRYRIRYNQPDEVFDTITRLLAATFKISETYISFVDRNVVYYKSHHGTPKTESLREESFCSVTILSPDVTVFEDTATHPLFITNPFVHKPGGIRFYAGAPLITSNGSIIGAVCLADTEGRQFSDADKAILQDFAKLVMQRLETHAASFTGSQETGPQKSVQSAQQKIHEQAYQLFLNAPAAFSIYKGANYVVELANNTAIELAGKGAGIIGKPILDILPEIEAQGFIKLLDQVVQTGNPYHAYEAPVTLTIDGNCKTLFVNFVYQPLFDEDGNTTGVMAFAIDVSEQVEARQKIEASRKRLRNVLEQSPIPTLILKGNDLIVDIANRPMADLWPAGALQEGKPLLTILPHATKHYYYDLLLSVINTGKTYYEHEAPAWFFDNVTGDNRFFEFVYQPFTEAEATISGVMVIATEVTEQVISRRQLLESETNFRTLVMQAPVGICILEGGEFTITETNNSFLHISGRQKEEVLNKPIWKSIPEMKTLGFDNILQQVSETGKAYKGKEFPVHILKGQLQHEIYVDFVFEPLKEKDGSIKKILVLAIDVSDKVFARKQLEDVEERARLAIESRRVRDL